jgi:nucleotide-binding universal stress UspA family protein
MVCVRLIPIKPGERDAPIVVAKENNAMKILLAADGSSYTTRAAVRLVQSVGELAKPPEIHVLHVHPPLPYPGIARAIGRKALREYQRNESHKALEVAEKVLGKAGIAYQSTWLVGDIADIVADYVKRCRIDLVVMGSHGHGALLGLALGSVATKLVSRLHTPILIVTPP